jgi:phosphate transport system substrate-binding protein
MVGALVSSPWSFEASAAEKLTIAGSSTVKPIVEAAAASFKKSHGGLSIVIGGGGSSNGVENAANGKVDIGMASRKLKDKEKNAFPDLVPVPVGQDGVALIVHKSNPVENLTKSQVLELYTGKIGSWSGVGGEDRSVELVGILLHHGTSSVFMKFFGLEAEEQGEGATKTVNYWSKAGGKSMTGSAKGVDGNQPSCAAVITEPGAVSFASIGFAQSLAEKGAPIKLLKLEGVDPTAENVVSGAYALSRPLLVITNGEASGRAKAFIDHLLSAEGQKIVEDKGYIPVQ